LNEKSRRDEAEYKPKYKPKDKYEDENIKKYIENDYKSYKDDIRILYDNRYNPINSSKNVIERRKLDAESSVLDSHLNLLK